MKKLLICFFFICIIATIFSGTIYGKDKYATNQLIDIKEKNIEEIHEYQIKYGDDTYGFVAYYLNKIRIYSIPISFIGYSLVGIYYTIGLKHLGTLTKALPLKVTITTLFVICQILPLVFALVMYLN